jgi:hypothetical protein
MSRNLGPHERQAPLLPSVVGPNPGGRPGLHRGPRSPSGGVGRECAALGSGGPALDRAGAAELPELVATAVERPAPGLWEALTPRAQWPSTGGTAWP